MASPVPSTGLAPDRTTPAAALPPKANNAAAGTKRKRASEKKFYAVKEGKKPGIYNTWDECLDQVRGHRGAEFKSFYTVNEAQDFIAGKHVPKPADSSNSEQKFYAVQRGHVPGVYLDWPTTQAQVRGVSHPRHKKFNTRAEAEAFVADGKTHLGGTSTADKVSAEEEIRRLIIKNSAPGLQPKGPYIARDKNGDAFGIGTGPLPPGAEDGFDPNIRLNGLGQLVHKTDEEKAKTKEVPRETNPPAMLRIYTDGSSLRNGTAGARAGVGVFFGPLDPKNVSEALKGSKQTNQRAELTAIQRALDIAPRHRDVTIYTDSKYAIDCVTNWYRGWEKNGWVNSKGKPVENVDLVKAVRSVMKEREEMGRKTLLVWVKGHANNPGNVEADRLAVAGARMGRGVGENGEDTENDTESYEDGYHGRVTKVESNQDLGVGSTTGSLPSANGAEEADVQQAFADMHASMANDEKSGGLNYP